MVDATRVECARFALVSFTLDFIDALLRRDRLAAQHALDVTIPDLDWIETNERFLHFRREDLIRDPAASPWLARAIVLPDATMAGHIGFHGPPDNEGIAEIGYTVFEPHRRRGYALEDRQPDVVGARAPGPTIPAQHRAGQRAIVGPRREAWLRPHGRAGGRVRRTRTDLRARRYVASAACDVVAPIASRCEK